MGVGFERDEESEAQWIRSIGYIPTDKELACASIMKMMGKHALELMDRYGKAHAKAVCELILDAITILVDGDLELMTKATMLYGLCQDWPKEMLVETERLVTKAEQGKREEEK